MRSLDGLFAEVAADLDADAPRLVLADALQAAGDPRGELIAIQCELARLGYDRVHLALIPPRVDARSSDRRADWIGDALADADERGRIDELRGRAARLIWAHAEQWEGDLTWAHDRRHRYIRGFIDHVDAGQDPDLRAVFARAPLLRSLAVELRGDAAVERLPQLRQLRVSGRFDGVAELTNLRELAVDRGSIVDLPMLAQLEALDLHGHRLPRDELAAVLAHTTLRDLRLGNNGPGSRFAVVLAEAPRVGSLEILDLYYANPDLDLAPLIPHLVQLRALRIHEPSRNSCFIAGARAIGDSLPALRVLDLSWNPFARFLEDLLAGRGLDSLTHLSLRGCHLNHARIDQLVKWPRLAQLRVLDLRDNALTAVSMLKIVDAVSDRIELLDLRRNRMAPQVETLLRTRHPSMRVLTGSR